MAPLFRWTSWRHARGRPMRTGLTVLGVAVGVAVVVAVGLVNDSVIRGLRRAAERVTGTASLVITGDRTGIPERVLERVRAVPGVDLATPLIKQVTPIRAANGRGARGLLLVLGLDMLEERLRQDPDARDAELVVPDPIVLFEQTHSLVLSETLASALGVAKDVGRAELTLVTPDGPRAFTVHGLLKGGARLRDLGDRVALMDFESAAKAFGKVGRFDEIRVSVRAGATDAERNAVAQQLREVVGSGFEVERPQNRGQPAERVLATWQAGLSLIALLTLLVGMFLAYQAVAVAAAERRREVGVLRAIGVTRRSVVLLFLGDAALVGVVGSALGVGLGVWLAGGLLHATGEMIQSYVVYVELHEVFYAPGTLVVGALTGFGACLLAGIAPALAAARMRPVDALARGLPTAADRASTRARPIAGLLLLAAAGLSLLWPTARASEAAAGTIVIATLVGFLLLTPVLTPALLRWMGALARRLRQTTFELALHNARRSPQRAAVTVNVVVVGFGLVVSTAALAHSFEGATIDFLRRSIPADLIVTCGSDLYGPTSMPMPAAFASTLAQVPGVAEVQGIRYTDARLENARVDVLSFDSAAWSRRGATLRAIEGDTSAIVLGLVRAQGVAVSENLARAFRVGAGDLLRLRTPSGERGFRVLGVVADYSSPFGVVAMDRALYRRHWDDDRIDQFHVFARPGGDVTALRDAVAAHTARHDVFVLTSGEVRARIRRLVQESFAIVRLQEVIALLVALLGLASLLSREVLYRTREIGILRALGATRARVAALVVAEGVALGVVGAGLGLVLGAALSLANVEALAVAQMGWRFPYVFPWSAAGALVPSLLAVAALASLLPAARATRTRPAEAVREE